MLDSIYHMTFTYCKFGNFRENFIRDFGIINLLQ